VFKLFRPVSTVFDNRLTRMWTCGESDGSFAQGMRIAQVVANRRISGFWATAPRGSGRSCDYRPSGCQRHHGSRQFRYASLRSDPLIKLCTPRPCG